MSSYSTSNIVKHVLSTDLLKHIVTSGDFDANGSYSTDEFARRIFSNQDTKKEFPKVVANIITEDIRDRIDSHIE